MPALLMLGGILQGVAMFAASAPALPLPGAATGARSTTEEKYKLTTESVTQKRAALKREIAATREESSKLSESMTEDSVRWLTQETALLERLDAVHAEQERTLQHAADLAKEAPMSMSALS